MRERVPDGFDLQHAMSPPLNNKQKGRGKRNSAGNANGLGSPLFPDLHDGDGLFDSEAQSHLNKNRQALANRSDINLLSTVSSGNDCLGCLEIESKRQRSLLFLMRVRKPMETNHEPSSL